MITLKRPGSTGVLARFTLTASEGRLSSGEGAPACVQLEDLNLDEHFLAKVRSYVREHPGVDAELVADALDVSIAEAVEAINRLIEQGILTRA